MRAPTYWLRGKITAIESRRHLASVCPPVVSAEAMRLADWQSLMAASPCVASSAEVREVNAQRVTLALEAWETPWSVSHGGAGVLFRGRFLDQVLVRGGRLMVDAHWLLRCQEAR